jgi:hypothetical protein
VFGPFSAPAACIILYMVRPYRTIIQRRYTAGNTKVPGRPPRPGQWPSAPRTSSRGTDLGGQGPKRYWRGFVRENHGVGESPGTDGAKSSRGSPSAFKIAHSTAECCPGPAEGAARVPVSALTRACHSEAQ